MADRPAGRKRQVHTARVVRTEQLTPHMVRVVLGDAELPGFTAGEWTDHYVKLLFPAPGAAYPEPYDLDAIRRDLPRDRWPVTRTYTVRRWDPKAREVTLDFVVHGESGVAGPWALRARPGETVRFLGPGGAYAPSPAADWHLLAGDESALPAIAASLERVPDGAVAHVLVEVADEAERQPLAAPEGAAVTWLHRDGGPVGRALVAAVRALDFPPGRAHAFVHGEAGMVKELRRHLRLERGLPREQLSISGYWRLGHDEDGWQSSKKRWNEAVEREQEGAEPAVGSAP
ncbi:siderophore-interacting protein [Streptomyces sp. MAR4 CNX-425]|uniref:siderophore-interacting protein n=1 Tax=Streptomyces sp. MAR4 CNX-425 TaxID=3406343 RepID=UPI003B50776F